MKRSKIIIRSAVDAAQKTISQIIIPLTNSEALPIFLFQFLVIYLNSFIMELKKARKEREHK
jgi:hypothetical protein